MFCNLYLNQRTGAVLVPTRAKTEAGYWLDVEPVDRASVDNLTSIVRALRRAMEQKEVIIPTPTRSAFPKPVVLGYSKARSWADFEKRHTQFSIAQTTEGQYKIDLYKRVSEGTGGAVVDEARGRVLARRTPLEDIAAEVLSMMRSELL
jgi:hypothetical protein